MDNPLLHKNKLQIRRNGKRSHPLEETTMMALGLTKSLSNSVRLWLPSKLATSMISGDESTQNINLRWTSTAKPSGLTRSPGSKKATLETSIPFKDSNHRREMISYWSWWVSRALLQRPWRLGLWFWQTSRSNKRGFLCSRRRCRQQWNPGRKNGQIYSSLWLTRNVIFTRSKGNSKTPVWVVK